MLCKIADLIVEIPETGDMVHRCQEYLVSNNEKAQIILNPDYYDFTRWPKASEDLSIYMESGFQFYLKLLCFEGLMLHASAVELKGKAYLFSGACGVGKSTHTSLWKVAFGDAAQVFNDDKPALRYEDGRWFAYGTPWCGKDGINQNKKVPLAGICFLKQAENNTICRLTPQESAVKVISQTMYKFKDVQNLYRMLSHVDKLVRDIPIYELNSKPVVEAAHLSFDTMYRGALEVGL